MKLSLEVELSDGYSAETIEQTRKVMSAAAEYIPLFAAKQEAYGRQNIAAFGEEGVVLRLHDKVQRLINLVWRRVSTRLEPARDSWLDVIGYGLIGLLNHDGEW